MLKSVIICIGVPATLLKRLQRSCFPVNIADILKSDSDLPNKTIFVCFNESPLKMMKNAFHFILKALFVLKIFEFLSRLFGHEGKTA